MKKEWKKPELEVLDVNETMLGADGDYTDDADFDAGDSYRGFNFLVK